MRFLVDECLHESLVELAHANGYDLARAVRLASAGVAAGLVAAFFLSRFLGSLLFGISEHDAVAYAGTAVLLVGVALLASYLPARRAARTDPMTALRYE
jgi:putative ABC transport system permease protein